MRLFLDLGQRARGGEFLFFFLIGGLGGGLAGWTVRAMVH